MLQLGQQLEQEHIWNMRFIFASDIPLADIQNGGALEQC